jgi:hypothetical protein
MPIYDKYKSFLYDFKYIIISARHENTQWSARQCQAMSLGVSVAGNTLTLKIKTSLIIFTRKLMKTLNLAEKGDLELNLEFREYCLFFNFKTKK